MWNLEASDTVTPESGQNEQNKAHIRHQGPRISIFCNLQPNPRILFFLKSIDFAKKVVFYKKSLISTKEKLLLFVEWRMRECV